MRITFLGGGNMADALIGGLLNQGFSPDNIAVIEIDEKTRQHLSQTLGVCCFAQPQEEALNCDVLLLAVKPQHMREVCLTVQPLLKQQLIISIAAGLRLTDLVRWLGNYQRIVRAMPNTPALIGAGMAGLYAMPDVSDEERLHAERILNAVGDTLWVNLEEQLDGITAISGSGPAYVFLFIESLQKAAVNLGFSQEDANLLVMKTLLGSARLAEESDDSAEVLRLRVTSKGGTTEAALKLLGERGFQDTVLAAVEAAFLRSSDLGQFLGRD